MKYLVLFNHQQLVHRQVPGLHHQSALTWPTISLFLAWEQHLHLLLRPLQHPPLLFHLSPPLRIMTLCLVNFQAPHHLVVRVVAAICLLGQHPLRQQRQQQHQLHPSRRHQNLELLTSCPCLIHRLPELGWGLYHWAAACLVVQVA